MDNQLAPKPGMSAVGSLSAGLEASSLHPMAADEAYSRPFSLLAPTAQVGILSRLEGYPLP